MTLTLFNLNYVAGPLHFVSNELVSMMIYVSFFLCYWKCTPFIIFFSSLFLNSIFRITCLLYFRCLSLRFSHHTPIHISSGCVSINLASQTWSLKCRYRSKSITLGSNVAQWFQLSGTALTAASFSFSFRYEKSSGLRQTIFARDIETIRLLNDYLQIVMPELFTSLQQLCCIAAIQNYEAAFNRHNYRIALMSGNGIEKGI